MACAYLTLDCLGCESCEDASFPSYRYDFGYNAALPAALFYACISGRQLIEKRPLPGAPNSWGLLSVIR